MSDKLRMWKICRTRQPATVEDAKEAAARNARVATDASRDGIKKIFSELDELPD